MAISVVVVLVAGVAYKFLLAALGTRLKKLVARAASIAITAPNLKNTILNRPYSEKHDRNALNIENHTKIDEKQSKSTKHYSKHPKSTKNIAQTC